MIKKIYQKAKGFTLVEITFVVVLIAAIATMGLATYRSVQLRIDLDTQVEKLVAEMRLVRGKAISGELNGSHGIHLASDSYTVFIGDVYNDVDPLNYEISLPATFTIENISLNGGGADVVFSASDGSTTTYGSFDFVSNQIDKSRTVNVSSLGVINY